jgi:hypothetical protein
MIWAIVGFVSAFVDLYIFFRGMVHMIACHINHKNPAIKNLGYHMLKQYTERAFGFYIIYFGIYTILGPITTIVLISDFFRFTFDEK